MPQVCLPFMIVEFPDHIGTHYFWVISDTFSEVSILCMPCTKLQLETFTEGTNMIQTNWASTLENLSFGLVNNKGADQPVHPRSVISAFYFCSLKSIISRLATRKKIDVLASLCS